MFFGFCFEFALLFFPLLSDLHLLVLSLLLLHLSFFSLLLLLLSLVFHEAFTLFFLRQEILTCFHFDVFLAWLLLWREWIVLPFFNDFSFLPLLPYLFEFWQKTIPVLPFHILILHQLALDHEFFNVIDWMHILHGIDDYSPQNFDLFESTNDAYCAPLHENITLCQ